ncbi:MAG TPA: DUF1153 domain-containing protein [Candidatus Acidoferrum sp.]|nr:DUF1153 domain-containing protein [Candidatus Acidoferrum sp.]
MRRQTLEVNARIYDFFYLAASAFLKGARLFCVKVVEVWSKTDMGEDRRGRVSYVIGPDGSPLTLADLPPPNTKRWVIRRKAEVVAAVRGGLLSLDEACRRYTLTVEEFLAWQRAIDRFGMPGLRATRVQQYRH